MINCFKIYCKIYRQEEIKAVSYQGNQPWIFIGMTDAEAETPILWPPDAKGQLIRKDTDSGKDWRQEEKGAIEDEMAGWHHQLDGHEFEQARELVMDREAWHASPSIVCSKLYFSKISTPTNSPQPTCSFYNVIGTSPTEKWYSLPLNLGGDLW